MTLLFDQNISHRVLRDLVEIYPGSKQVRELGLEGKFDIEIWDYAKKNAFTVVTFDVDFVNLSILFGSPPKIIWLKTGNTPTKRIAEILIENSATVNDFLTNVEESVLKIEFKVF